MASMRVLTLFAATVATASAFMAPAALHGLALRGPAICSAGLARRAPMGMSTLSMQDSLDDKKLFVGGIPWAFDSEDLREAFSSFGTVTDANIVYDRETGRSRGFGFVSFEETDAAKKACNEMDQAEVGGRTVNVNFAKARAPRPEY